MKKILMILSLFVLVFACQRQNTNKTTQSIEKYAESLDSSGFSIYLKEAIEKQKIFTHTITADIETKEVVSPPKTDAADDPAIWINRENLNKSLVLGTNKKGGIHVYNMEGEELQYLPVGCMNNIDLRDDFEYQHKSVVLVAASNCSRNTVSIFFLDKETRLLSEPVLDIASNVDLVYGVSMYKSQVSQKYYVFVNGEGAEVEQWEIYIQKDKLQASLVRNFKVSSKPEGMVADDKEGIIYIGVEEEGILKINAEPENKFETIWVNDSNPTDRSFISSDIEGLGLYKTKDKTYMIASSQGNFSYAIFELGEPDKYLGSFVIKDGIVDGVIETDGLDIVNDSINEKFPKGMLVVQDGYNFDNDSIKRQNFKYISWERIEKIVQLF